ncbi:MAG: LexA family transcriptional regulator, partial [Trueperaceae bacterium]
VRPSLSPAQHRIYERLRDHAARFGGTPDLAEFARELGVHYVSLKQHLTALADKGYLTFESRGRGRSPRLALPADVTGVPVLGSIPAGPLTEAVAHAEAYLPIAGLHGRAFALRVQGDSMADLIQDGDMVLFEKRPPRRSGEICAVRIGDDDVTLKYLDRLEDARYALRPHNPAYPVTDVAADQLEIEGVYAGLLRGTLSDLLTDAPDEG